METKRSAAKATLRQWQLFILAVEKGSFLAASAAANTDVAVVSREITKLEHLLQEPLLERSRSGVRPTWLGAQKFKEAVKLLHDINAVLSDCATDKRASLIRLAVPGSLSGLIAKPLAEFEKLHSSNHARIEINSYQNINDIQPENFDLIICTQTLPNVRMVAYDIASISFGIFASPDFVYQNEAVEDPVQLEKLPLIHSKSEKVLLHGPFQSLTITVEPQIRINSDDAMISSAVEGLGIALSIPLWAAEPLVKSGKLIRILRDWHLPNAPVWLLKHPGQKISALEKLIPFLRETWSLHPTLTKTQNSRTNPRESRALPRVASPTE